MTDASGNGRIEMLFQMVQDTNNHVLDMIQNNAVIKISQEDLGVKMKTLSDSMESLTTALINKMTPDRCAHMHDDLKKQIFREVKDGATGWARRGLVTLKILAYISATFGGSAVGASALGFLP